VEGGEALLSGWTAGAQDVQAWTSAVKADMEVLASVRLGGDPVAAGYHARVVARAQGDARNGYAARISHAPSGAVSWGLSRVVAAGGAGSLGLGAGSLAASGGAGSVWWIRLRVQGTTVQARFWRDQAPEPAGWKVSVADGYWASGRASLGALVNAGAAAPFPSVGFGSFQATDLAGSAAALPTLQSRDLQLDVSSGGTTAGS
jgi:hypothetical protein